ncbi:MAG: hypothetical protein U5M23_14150 [Marinagarivorans sp.]|nr:hypothetical protein [Marinagarivorans sp.]
MQQINLYVSELRPQKDWFSAKYLSVMLVSIFTLLVLIDFVKLREVSFLSESLNDKQLVLRALELEIDESKAQKPTSNRQEIQVEIDTLKEKISAREQLVTLIQGQSINNFSFYRALTVMSKTTNNRVAINSFTFSRGGQYIEMEGEGVRSFDVPDYINALRSDPVFATSTFGLVSIGNVKASGNVDFKVGYDGSPSFNRRSEK